MVGICPECPADAVAIRAVHSTCFDSDLEARLVDALRDSGRLLASWVAVDGDAVVGHAAFSPVSAGNGAAGVGLAPLAVVESHRRQGIGADLVGAGLEACRQAGHGWAVVLGDPAYYQRFGFVRAERFGLRDEYDAGPAFQAMELIAGQLPRGGGLVRYCSEFASVG